MEKLQIAIEKARASRLAQRGQTDATGGQTSPEEAVSRHRDQGDAWAALREVSLQPKTLEKSRVIAYHSGALSTYYDILRTRLRDEVKRRGFRRIAVTSTGPGAGKSTTLANLSLSFGRMPLYRTMVLDFDLRRPSLHRLLGLEPKSDMGAVLRGEVPFDEHILRYGENVAFGLNAAPVPQSSELLQSERTHDFLSAVDDVYHPDLTLFDMPPFLAADDTQGFLSSIDGVLLVVESGKTTRQQLDSVEQKLSELTTVVGVVLNKCPFPDESDAGSYGYEYGY
ncbi:tyrosine-protein kinase family protein [Sinirhodobacter populi]|uniref:Tyrosine-protein kinase family protein n=1 Tax=Paenirhodobacter populi TaxID=2306993 RepID=A0A443KAS6_9RHOB|nr:CpsD/CapB family tyrosine-protein kinase [Sinirhodobacter populi]RWR29845.1 tyrosine-protein kinase family protein [Sinirhodobacter populi]